MEISFSWIKPRIFTLEIMSLTQSSRSGDSGVTKRGWVRRRNYLNVEKWGNGREDKGNPRFEEREMNSDCRVFRQGLGRKKMVSTNS